MDKVYMVHVERGEYSSWAYDVVGVFSTYERARDYVESQPRVIYRGFDHALRQCEDGEEPPYGACTAHPVTDDGVTFYYQDTDMNGVIGYQADTYFITPYDVDVPA